MEGDKERIAQAKRMMLTSLRERGNSARLQQAAPDQNRGATNLEGSASPTSRNALENNRSAHAPQEVKVEFTASQVNVEILPSPSSSGTALNKSAAAGSNQGNTDEQSRAPKPRQKQGRTKSRSTGPNSHAKNAGQSSAVRRGSRGGLASVSGRGGSERGDRRSQVVPSSSRSGGNRGEPAGGTRTVRGQDRRTRAEDSFSWERRRPTEEWPTEEWPTEEWPTEEWPTEEWPTEQWPTEERPPEERPAEQWPTENHPKGERPTEERPPKERPTEEQLAEQWPTDQWPTEQWPTDRLPTEERPTEQWPTEERPAEEWPTGQWPTEERPTDERPTEERPAEEWPTGQWPTEERPTKERPAEQWPTEQWPTEQWPTEQWLTEQQPTQERPTDQWPTEQLGGVADHKDPRPMEWRNGKVMKEEERDCTIDQLTSLKKELIVTVERFQNGGAGARVGMRRLQGTEKDEWAFIDESDVSSFHEQIEKPAMEFKFELDDFQKRAILQVERGNSVFVAAHTSAGKTAVAEYAIALAAECEQKAFYTSPIKTLSNQKLRDFREKFADVGLVTGDVSIDDDAQCVIMTTEILRSMLYRGADVIRNVKYVIFDEVQFLNDEERGVVWEESIIMLPPHVVIIMLSATVPNALEFASWVGKTKNRKVAVVSTLKRPVPLRHSVFYHERGAQEELQETVLLEQGGNFLAENYKRAMSGKSSNKKAHDPKEKAGRGRMNKQKSGGELRKDETISDDQTSPNPSVLRHEKKGMNRNKGSSSKGDAAAATKGGGRGPNSKESQWGPLVSFLHEKECTPSVVFCFSKKKCEKAVQSLQNKDLLPDSGQKAHVHSFFEDAILRLREEDRDLPQVRRVRDHLKRGFAAHHAGLLPLVKEITEILFSQGFVKVLFATETFAMGVNMPARTVVFAGLRKHDGRRFRYLEAGEYTQMSGRAGRRGHDKVGNVYIFFPPDERVPDDGAMARIMTGRPISLRSAFRLTYNMILNVLRVDELRVEEVMKQSFSENHGTLMAKGITAMLDKAGETLSGLNIDDVSPTQASSSTSSQESRESEPVTLESALPVYVAKFSKLAQASSELTFRDINPIFRDAVRPGRAVIMEVNPGFLSLCVVYSIVPYRRKSGARQAEQSESQAFVRYDSLLWVASISGVRPGAIGRHISSVLLLPDSQRKDKYVRDQAKPEVVSSDGLVVTLQRVEASKIMYICNEYLQLSSVELDAQANASRRWHFAKNPHPARKTLPRSAAFLQSVVAKWRKKHKCKNMSAMERFIDEVAVKKSKGIDGGGRNSTKNTSNRMQQRKFVPTLPETYRRRMNICLELITDENLADCIIDSGGKDLLSNAAWLVLLESVKDKMSTLKRIHEAGSEPVLLPEYHQRVDVLQALNYVGSDRVSVQLKGRCACEVATVDSVVLTEIIVENVLENLEPAEIASLLSSLVCRKKNSGNIHDRDEERYSPEYLGAKAKMREVVEDFGVSQAEAGVELEFDIGDGQDYEGSICRWELAYAIYEWARGGAFFTITELTEQQEGDIVVCVKRLIELLRDSQAVAKIIGNMELLKVLETAVESVRRDVVFSGSLYYDRPTSGENFSETDSEYYEE